MTTFVVDAEGGSLLSGSLRWPCVIGRGGLRAAADKREGDGCTPIGDWPIRGALLRRDGGMTPPPRLPWRWIRPSDGWSDDSRDTAYNRPVRHPHPFSAERLWRTDRCYDAVIVIGHNDAPPAPGSGSAIFLHLIGSGPTDGCVAIDRPAMSALLSMVAAGDRLAMAPTTPLADVAGSATTIA